MANLNALDAIREVAALLGSPGLPTSTKLSTVPLDLSGGPCVTKVSVCSFSDSNYPDLVISLLIEDDDGGIIKVECQQQRKKIELLWPFLPDDFDTYTVAVLFERIVKRAGWKEAQKTEPKNTRRLYSV